MVKSSAYAFSSSALAIAVAALLLSLGAVSNLRAQFVVDFDVDDTGTPMVAGTYDIHANQPYTDLFASGVGVTLSTGNPTNRPLNLYDSEGSGGEDPDLERDDAGDGEWEGGTEVSTVFDNLLIVNETSNIAIPDDDGVGGSMIFDFDIALTSFGFDFVDLDTAVNGTITFTDVGRAMSTAINFSDFEDGSGSIHEVTGALFGDRHANSIPDITAAELGLTDFDRVTISLTSSGGIGTVMFTTVPEPGCGLALAFSSAWLVFYRRRRRVAA